MKYRGDIWLDEERTIRMATDQDTGVFVHLWGEYMADQEKQGGELLANQRNLDAMAHIFRAIVAQQKTGVVALGAHDNAILMWGGSGPFELRFGPTVHGWGTYVRPTHRGQGWSRRMREAAAKRLRELGFAAVVGAAVEKNELGLSSGVSFGFEIYSQQGVLRL